MKNITLKGNDSLKKLAIMAGKEPEEVAEKICNTLAESDHLFDIPDNAGLAMPYYLEQEGLIVQAATLKCFGKSTLILNQLFSGLVLWHKANECPYCGSPMEIDEEQSVYRPLGLVYGCEPDIEIIHEEKKCSNWSCNCSIHTK